MADMCDFACVGMPRTQLASIIGVSNLPLGAGCRLGWSPVNMRHIGGASIEVRGQLSPSCGLHPAYCRLGRRRQPARSPSEAIATNQGSGRGVPRYTVQRGGGGSQHPRGRLNPMRAQAQHSTATATHGPPMGGPAFAGGRRLPFSGHVFVAQGRILSECRGGGGFCMRSHRGLRNTSSTCAVLPQHLAPPELRCVAPLGASASYAASPSGLRL